MAQQSVPGKPKTTRLPLMGAYSNRGSSGTKDQRFVNVFPETRKVDQLENTKIFINKRPGLTLAHNFSSANTGRGCIYFSGKFYVAIGTALYSWDGNPLNAHAAVSGITLASGTTPIGLALANSSTLGDYLFVCDGTNGWVIKSDHSVVAITANIITRLTILVGGIGYNDLYPPTLTIAPPSSGTTATATLTLTDGTITAATITNAGSGYTTSPTCTIVLTGFSCTADTTTDKFTKTSHGLDNGDEVKFSGTTLPTGITAGTSYFVINKTADTFEVSTTVSGTKIDLTVTNGSGIVCTPQPSVEGSITASVNSFPSPHIPSPTFIDGYILLAVGSDVYNCDLDEPTYWSSDNYLSAEMFPDPVVALARQNNQVVVLGHSSIEFFYDAANAAGSPLTRNDSTTIQMGTAAPYAVYQNEKFCIYVSQSDSGGRAVWIIEGFQPKKISDEYIERILDADTSITTARGYGLRTKGHLFYVLNLKGANRTLVYDVDEKLWHEWSSNVTSAHSVFACDYMTDNSSGAAYLLHSANGCLYKLDPTKYTDDSTAILVELVTNKYDMDTYSRKFMTSVKVVGDRYETTNNVSLYFTDDDYQTWSNAKTISLTDDYPAFQRMGVFRRRAFKITHSSDNPLRLESLECTYNEGSY